MKRLFALILVVALSAAALGLTVFAYSHEGSYNGKYWVSHLTKSKNSATTSFFWAGGGVVQSKGTIRYQRTNVLPSPTYAIQFNAVGKKQLSKTQNVASGYVVTQVSQQYYIGNAHVDSLIQ